VCRGERRLRTVDSLRKFVMELTNFDYGTVYGTKGKDEDDYVE